MVLQTHLKPFSVFSEILLLAESFKLSSVYPTSALQAKYRLKNNRVDENSSSGSARCKPFVLDFRVPDLLWSLRPGSAAFCLKLIRESEPVHATAEKDRRQAGL